MFSTQKEYIQLGGKSDSVSVFLRKQNILIMLALRTMEKNYLCKGNCYVHLLSRHIGYTILSIGF